MIKRIVIEYETYTRRTNVSDRIVEHAVKQLRRDGCGLLAAEVQSVEEREWIVAEQKPDRYEL